MLVSYGHTRREFLRSAVASGTVCFAHSQSLRKVAGSENRPSASEQIRIGVIGTGVRGKYLIGNLPSEAKVVAICDCATSRLAGTLEPQGEFEPVLARFRQADAAHCATYQDYRRMLDREQLDAVIIATPDHHHVPAAMRALQAELDVYLEKPLSVTIGEGRLLTNMVKRTCRVLQVGSQQRSMEINRFACEFIRDGGLGRVSKVELPNYPGPIVQPDFPEEPIPGDIDWNLFCGPAPLRPYHRHLWQKEDYKVDDLLWRGWDLFRDYSGHLMTNWGAHGIDMVQYALGRDGTGPVEIDTERPQSNDTIWQTWKNKTPRPQGAGDRRFWPVTMRYSDGVQLRFFGGPDSIVFYGTRGRLLMGRNYFETDPHDLAMNRPDPEIAQKWQGSGHVARPHLENWFDCIRSRGVPNAPVEAAHRTVTICHLANLARELNRALNWDPTAEQFQQDPEASELLNRPYRQGFEPLY